jgi:thioredoxin reductase (NADPH)
MDDILDCAVIGGGPAGLTAGIYLGRFRRRVAVFDTRRSRAEWIPRSHNLPGFPEGVKGPVLLERMRDQARLYGVSLREQRVEAMSRAAGEVFCLQVDGSSVLAKTVLLATGVLENEPALPRVDEAVRRGVIRICPICDGYESIGRSIAVLGNSEHAAAEALFLRTYTEQLTLILVGQDNRISDPRRKALAEAGAAVIEAGIDSVQLHDDGRGAVCTAGGEARRFDAIYSAFGTTPQSQLAEAVGARLDEDRRLYADDHQQTSVEGLYAAGDLVRGLNQISVATGEAAIAATAIHNRLPRIWG